MSDIFRVCQRDTVLLKHLIDMITDLHQLFLLSAVQGNARVLKAEFLLRGGLWLVEVCYLVSSIM